MMRPAQKKRFGIVLSAVVVSLLVAARKRRQRCRRYGVRPFLKNNKKHGQYQRLVKYMLENDEEEFFSYTRMSPQVFRYMMELLRADLRKHRSRTNALPPELRLAVTLHYLAEGMSMREIARNFVIGRSTVHYVIKETCEAIWCRLMPIFLPPPTIQQFTNIANEFWKRWNIPNCIGAVDGKHVIVEAPAHSGSDYFSYKKTFSLVLMAVCDSYYKFTMVDIGAQGSLHDSTVFRESAFGKAFLNDNLPVPPVKHLPGTDISLPHFIVADQAFPLHEKIMRPYPSDHLTEEQKIFNYRISRARRTIENTFGILVQRWGILKTRMATDISMCESITKACVVLHNFLQCGEESIPENERRYCPTGLIDQERPDGSIITGAWRQQATLEPVRRLGSNNSTRNARRNRDILSDYFNSPNGSVPYQQDIVMKGAIPI